MRGLEQRARRLGDIAAGEARRRLAARVRIPGVTVSDTGRGIVLSGRGLLRRLANDERLRWIGGWLR